MIPDLKPGDRLSVYVGDQPSGAAEAVSAASVRGHIWVPSDSVNAFLEFYFKKVEERRISAVLPAILPLQGGYEEVNFNRTIR